MKSKTIITLLEYVIIHLMIQRKTTLRPFNFFFVSPSPESLVELKDYRHGHLIYAFYLFFLENLQLIYFSFFFCIKELFLVKNLVKFVGNRRGFIF